MRRLSKRLFFMCVVVVAFIGSTTICFGDDYGREYSVLELILMERRQEFAAKNGITFMRILQMPLGMCARMFLPFVAVFPFLNMFWAERTKSYASFMMSRIGRKKYLIMYIFDCLASSGLVVFFGYALYYAAVFFLFSSLDGDAVGFGVIFKELARQLLPLFLYGAFVGTPALFLSSFLENRYVTCCIPFVLIYLYDKMTMGTYWETASLASLYWIENPAASLAVHASEGVGFALLFYIIMDERGKRGEV